MQGSPGGVLAFQLVWPQVSGRGGASHNGVTQRRPLGLGVFEAAEGDTAGGWGEKTTELVSGCL